MLRRLLSGFRRLVEEWASLGARRRMVAAQPARERPLDVVFYFSESDKNLYQIREWYAPLADLLQHVDGAVVCTRMDVAEVLRAETELAVYLSDGVADIDSYLREAKVIIYPNQSRTIHDALAVNGARHLFVSHGESDKIYTFTNTIKAFSTYLVAGQVAQQRLDLNLLNFNTAERTARIGRPQLDHLHVRPSVREDGRSTVLYAPTWEGLGEAMCYGSGPSHGVSLVEQLLTDERIALIYRPHPLIGTIIPAYAAADRQIRTLLEDASHGSAVHRIDDGPIGDAFSAADLLICDVSALAYDWLSTGKPLLMTHPVEPGAAVEGSRLKDAVPSLRVEDLDAAHTMVTALLTDRSASAAMRQLAADYYGDLTPGAATSAFAREVGQALDEVEKWRAGHPAPAASAAQPARTARRELLSLARTRVAGAVLGGGAEAESMSRMSRSEADFLIVFTSIGAQSRTVSRWAEVIDGLDAATSVAVLVTDPLVYRTLRKTLDVDVYLWRGQGAPHAPARALATKVFVYVEPSAENLRFTAVQDVFHAYLAHPEDQTELWLSHRLRVFDRTLAPEAAHAEWAAEHILDHDPNSMRVTASSDDVVHELLLAAAHRDVEVIDREQRRLRGQELS